MYKLVMSSVAAATIVASASAVNLVPNGDFNDGGTGWNSWAGGTYYYTDGSDTIASFGWWDGANLYREIDSYYQADTVYTYTVVARNGDGSCRGAVLGLQKIDNGVWSAGASQTYDFGDADKGIKGAWRTYTFTIDTRDAQYASLIGKKIAVSVGEHANSDWGQYGWLHVNSVSLEAQAVPEPFSMAALGLGALAVVTRKRRKA